VHPIHIFFFVVVQRASLFAAMLQRTFCLRDACGHQRNILFISSYRLVLVDLWISLAGLLEFGYLSLPGFLVTNRLAVWTRIKKSSWCNQ
jgi:hypothetical protein